MPDTAIIIGAAGVGKTKTLLETLDKAIHIGNYDPREVGFVSFTRAARREAAERAGAMFNLKPADLEQGGWFRTIHSICYKQLAVGDELLAPNKETSQWLKDELGEDVGGTGDQCDDEVFISTDRTPKDADLALAMWGIARSMLVPFSAVHERSLRTSDYTPPLKECRRIVERYEQAKRLNHRCDFTDLLGRFGGKIFQFDGPLDWSPQGEVPSVPVWIFDEAQDHSPLLDLVARRLVENSRWVYLAGDPFQSVYGFAGAAPGLFQAWEHKPENRHVLAKSYRCPAPVVTAAEQIIKGCSDYWDRGVVAADHDGSASSGSWQGFDMNLVDPSESWLFLARTNFQARRMMGRLNGNAIPHLAPRVKSVWDAPSRNRALAGLLGLSRGEVCFATEWKEICQRIPSKALGAELLARGTKVRWEKQEIEDEQWHSDLAGLVNWGATPALIEQLRNGRWVELIDQGCSFQQAVAKFGMRYTLAPQIRVGSIHSAKGLEADNVVILTTTSHQVNQSRLDVGGEDEERRVAYVGVTRARKNLYVLRESCRFEMEIPL